MPRTTKKTIKGGESIDELKIKLRRAKLEFNDALTNYSDILTTMSPNDVNFKKTKEEGKQRLDEKKETFFNLQKELEEAIKQEEIRLGPEKAAPPPPRPVPEAATPIKQSFGTVPGPNDFYDGGKKKKSVTSKKNKTK